MEKNASFKVSEAILVPVDYHGKPYPEGILPPIQEVAGHFDIDKIFIKKIYSLHTEYSYTVRRLNSHCLKDCPNICSSHSRAIPRLWYSDKWAMEFAEFIKVLTYNHEPPTVIEIHPPFNDYCTMEQFFQRFRIFEREITKSFGPVEILIENRSGTQYREGVFLLSTINDLCQFSQYLDGLDTQLKITLDLPQLLTAHAISKSKQGEMLEILDRLKEIRHNIKGIHLWGKRLSSNNKPIAHMGDLNTYFRGNTLIKEAFLQKIQEVFADDIPRFFVPEVNSGNEDLISIVEDLVRVGFKFINDMPSNISLDLLANRV